jgi:hypothetical protein
VEEWRARIIEALATACPGIAQRGKMGFGVPLDQWFAAHYVNWCTTACWVNSSSSAASFHPTSRYPVEHESSRRSNYHQIYALLMLELWFESRQSLPPHLNPPFVLRKKSSSFFALCRLSGGGAPPRSRNRRTAFGYPFRDAGGPESVV